MMAGMKRGAWLGDFWGGLAAMLVALPSSIAFGVTIFAPLGGATRRTARSPASSAPPRSASSRR